jgi:hypothetical protein
MAYYRSVFGDDADIKPGWETRWDKTHSIRVFGPPGSTAWENAIGSGMLDQGELKYDRGSGTPASNFVGTWTAVVEENYIPESLFVTGYPGSSPYLHGKRKVDPPGFLPGFSSPVSAEILPFDVPYRAVDADPSRGLPAVPAKDQWFLRGSNGGISWKVIHNGQTLTAPFVPGDVRSIDSQSNYIPPFDFAQKEWADFDAASRAGQTFTPWRPNTFPSGPVSTPAPPPAPTKVTFTPVPPTPAPSAPQPFVPLPVQPPTTPAPVFTPGWDQQTSWDAAAAAASAEGSPLPLVPLAPLVPPPQLPVSPLTMQPGASGGGSGGYSDDGPRASLNTITVSPLAPPDGAPAVSTVLLYGLGAVLLLSLLRK